jgi:hypothetical protein
MSGIMESKITIPGTDVKLPSWAVLAGGAGIAAALIFGQKGQTQQGDFNEDGSTTGDETGGLLGLIDELMNMFQGLELPGLVMEPEIQSPRLYVGSDGGGVEGDGTYIPAVGAPAFDYLERAAYLEAQAGMESDPWVRGQLASAARLTGMASLSPDQYAAAEENRVQAVLNQHKGQQSVSQDTRFVTSRTTLADIRGGSLQQTLTQQSPRTQSEAASAGLSPLGSYSQVANYYRAPAPVASTPVNIIPPRGNLAAP